MNHDEFFKKVREAHAKEVTFEDAKRVIESHGYIVIKPPDRVLLERGKPSPRPA